MEEEKRKAEVTGREYQTLFFVVTGYTKECSRVVTPDARKEGTNKVGSHRQGCAECQTSRFHQHGLVPPIPNTICALNEMYFLFSSI
jgi:hypothetical protein